MQLLVKDLVKMQPCPRYMYECLYRRVIASNNLVLGSQVEKLMALPAFGREGSSALLVQMQQYCPLHEVDYRLRFIFI